MSEKVLLVDDDRELRALLCELLEDAGYAVTAAEDPRRVPELLASAHFDAVVCDQRLGPGVQGTTLLDTAHAAGVIAHTACVLITGLPPPGERAWLFVLQKPFDLSELVATLQTAISTLPSPPAPEAPTEATPAEEPGPAAVARSGARSLHELTDVLLETQLDLPLRARIGRELRARKARLSRTELALELGRVAQEAGDLLRSDAQQAPTESREQGGEADAALRRLEREAAVHRVRVDGLSAIALRLGLAC